MTDSITYIHSSKPIYVWHASGNGCNLSGTQVPNIFCTGTYSTNFSRATADSLNLFLFVKAGFEGDFRLNGNNTIISAASFYDVPGMNGAYKAAKIYLPIASVGINSFNNLSNTSDVFGLGILNGAHSDGSAYTYLSEYTSYPTIEAGNQETVCANSVFNVNGIIGGGDVSGLWSTSGFGSFSFGNDTLSNQYIVNQLDTAISPINLILSTTGRCTPLKDTIKLYVTPAPFVNANTDQTVCANNPSVQLNGNVSGSSSSGQWTTTGNGSFTPNDTTLNALYTLAPADTANGGIQLILSTNFSICNEVNDTMQVFVTPAPIVEANADTIFVCENNSLVNLNGLVGGATSTGKWTTPGNGLFLPDNLTLNGSYQPSDLDLAGNSIYLSLSSTNNGDCIVAKDSLVVIFTKEPSVDAGSNLISCTNSPSVQLNGIISGPKSTGFWSGGNGSYNIDSSSLSAIYTPTAAELNNGIIYLTLSSTNNLTCNAVSDVVQINVASPPLANFDFTNECLGKNINFTDFSLSGSGIIDSWDWNLGDLTTAVSQDTNHIYESADIFNVQLIVGTDIGCSDTVVQQVRVYELPVSSFDYTSDCNSGQIILSFDDQSSANDLLNYWFYDFGTAGAVNAENPTQLFANNGNYNISHVVGTVNNCYDTIVQTIVIPAKPRAGFYYSTKEGLNIGAEFNFIDTSSYADSYLWIFDDGNNSTDPNPSNTFFNNGIYKVKQYITTAFGCKDSVTIPITINTVTQEISSLIPNAISPNGDDKNDVWKLDFLSFIDTEITVDIFNRWGQLVFHSDGYAIPWDATFNGNLVADGTYFYVINLNDDSENPIFKGNILVMEKAK